MDNADTRSIPIEWLLDYAEKWVDNADVINTIERILSRYCMERGDCDLALRLSDEMRGKAMRNYLNRQTRRKEPEMDEKSTEWALADARRYVMKLKGLVSAEWGEEKYAALWNAIFQLNAVREQIAAYGKQKNTTFNRYLVCNIICVLKNKSVFKPGTSDSTIAKYLEGTDQTSKREQVGTMPPRELKNAVSEVIKEVIG